MIGSVFSIPVLLDQVGEKNTKDMLQTMYLFRTKHMGTGILCGAARTSVPVPMCVAVGFEQITNIYLYI